MEPQLDLSQKNKYGSDFIALEPTAGLKSSDKCFFIPMADDWNGLLLF